MWLFQSELEALGLQQQVEDVKTLKMRLYGVDDGRCFFIWPCSDLPYFQQQPELN